jgi:hypothetical protein
MEVERRRAYMEVYERWQRDLQRLHSVLLDGAPLDPMHRVALLRSESHTHDRYEAARQTLLGIGPAGGADGAFADEEGQDA